MDMTTILFPEMLNLIKQRTIMTEHKRQGRGQCVQYNYKGAHCLIRSTTETAVWASRPVVGSSRNNT